MTGSHEFFRSLLEGYQSFFGNLLRFIAAALLIALAAAAVAFPLWFLAIQHTTVYSWILGTGLLTWLVYRSVRRKHLPRLLLRAIHIAGIILASYAAAAAFLSGAALLGLVIAVLDLLLFGLLIRRKTDRT
ncbi:hypothetical protein [Marispirochaeta sp.]|jgi:hypothetical protein|uniref:hypothetical protein n=1 Tax=Marispirochaeta sp. TaxID=2038653 RepID=UPI0029C719DB|nr:hypothetical protein [Marispirochaeta sp.]